MSTVLQWQGLRMNHKPLQISTIGNVSVIAVQIMTTMDPLSKLDISCYKVVSGSKVGYANSIGAGWWAVKRQLATQSYGWKRRPAVSSLESGYFRRQLL